jgi:hypothetical protein
MTREELTENLCVHDERSPHFYHDITVEDTSLFDDPDCPCDFCFSGRSKIAEHALELQADLDELKRSLKTIHSLADFREFMETK